MTVFESGCVDAFIFCRCLAARTWLHAIPFPQGDEAADVYRRGCETTLSWTDGPDVELNAASLKALDDEIAEFVRPQMDGAKIPFSVISLGKRRVEVMAEAADVPCSELNTEVFSFVRGRLGKLAMLQ